MGDTIYECGQNIPVCCDADICVSGGSCTGVFAAVRAARQGFKVVICEETNTLGGTAVNGLVNIWHSLKDISGKNQIIAGLTDEILQRLKLHGSLIENDNRSTAYNFNPSELSFELDELTDEENVSVRFHTKVCGVATDGDEVKAIIIEDGSGRRAVRAKFFIDCTGDGDLASRLGIKSYTNAYIQPPSACFHLQGDMSGVNVGSIVRDHGAEFGLGDDWGWSTGVAGCQGITMRADNHVFGVRCDIADDLTKAEKDGRRQMRAFLNMMKKYGRQDTNYAVTNIASYIGIRETIHYEARFRAEEIPLLIGTRYNAPVLNGTYPTDIHHSEDMGITFKHLDGTQRTILGKGTKTIEGSWRDELGIKTPAAEYYQLPFDILVQEKWKNFICTGRMLNADMGAFGALRVMVNLNQLGEAAGCASAICLDRNNAIFNVDGIAVSSMLKKGGSAL